MENEIYKIYYEIKNCETSKVWYYVDFLFTAPKEQWREVSKEIYVNVHLKNRVIYMGGLTSLLLDEEGKLAFEETIERNKSFFTIPNKPYIPEILNLLKRDIKKVVSLSKVEGRIGQKQKIQKELNV